MADPRTQQGSFTWKGEAAQRAIEPPGSPRGPGQRPPAGLWLTADEATAYLGLPTRKALYAAVARGQVPARRLGRRRLRFNRVELDALLGGLAKSTGVH
jgi:excisionase family DNA binding protein